MFNETIKCLLTGFKRNSPFKKENQNKTATTKTNLSISISIYSLGIWIKALYMHAIHLMHVTVVNAVGVQLFPHKLLKLNFTIAGEYKEIYITFPVTFYSIVFR